MKPVESRDVVAVASERYPVPLFCSVPDCGEPATAHHCFPRSFINGGSYFVSINGGPPVPHVVGLCGSGTTGHHGDVEEHRAWIKLEDGVWNWYESVEKIEDGGAIRYDVWELVGPLDPQPGYVGAPKKRKRKQGDERRKRRTISIRVPNDTENGGEIWDETLERVKDRLIGGGLYSEGDKIPDYEATIAAWNDWLNG